MDTTSNALSRTLHILAQRPDVQERLRDEIIEAGHGDNISYDELVSLPYLDAVCRETLRLYVTFALSYVCQNNTIDNIVTQRLHYLRASKLSPWALMLLLVS